MISWYIDSSVTSDDYIDKVRKTVEVCMDHICDKISTIDNTDLLVEFIKEIIDELPILKFGYSEIKDEVYFVYNRHTTIRLNDPLKLIKRDIVLNKILN